VSRESKDAIERARRHLRNAVREGLEASRALVEAAMFSGDLDSKSPGSRSGGGFTAEIRTALDAWISTLDGDDPFRMPESISGPLHRALQVEIDRWEKRSAEDDSARPVLRAFLGLRELLWELGMRETASNTGADKKKPPETAKSESTTTQKTRPRVQRFDLED
jgi:hypothetical protein